MVNNNPVVDAAQRTQALNPAESFIVQAPAGSGKTELLTQRFLALLATVNEPEQVVAITFTRKAAAEMRDRILQALKAAQGPQPEAAHAQQTWQLANAALAQDANLQWGLLASPSRLKVQTIDGLCGSLVRQMPVLSRLGGNPSTVDDAGPLYQEAAERALREALSADSPQADMAHKVVVHLDGRFNTATDLLALMLAKRDQWLRYLVQGASDIGNTDYFANAVAAIKAQAINKLAALLNATQRQQLADLCLAAANYLEDDSKAPALFLWRHVMADEVGLKWRNDADSLPLWLGLAECLLTAKGDYRSKRGLNKNTGFPPGPAGAGLKDDHASLVESLTATAPDFARQLQQLRGLPSGANLAQELAVLPAMAELLRAAVAELKLLFAERSEVDHAEVTEMALTALGPAEEPTDLALALDSQIQHVLADEVQDTSHNQFELFRRLTAGWQAGDGRSFFAVGDPMQSIYRFREADVGLFLQAWHYGLRADMPLTPLQLQVNFRSQAGIVDWVNQQFSRAFPSQEDSLLGAISYARSSAFHAPLNDDAVTWHLRHKAQALTEAEQAAAVVQAALNEDAQQTVAVLGRGRAHVADIVLALRQAGVAYRAIELESLAARPVVSDLMQLTLALQTPADRLAWLAVLRTPFCGLALADLLKICENDKQRPLVSLLRERIEQLSAHGQHRAQQLLEALPGPHDSRPLHQQVENIWFRMAGPLALSADDVEAAQLYLKTLAQLEQEGACRGRLDSIDALQRAVSRLYAPPANTGCRVDVMTMHKSKGLQFDVVLLPGLHRSTRAEDKLLLNIEALSFADGSEKVLLAPLSGREQADRAGSIYQWLQDLKAEKNKLERVRLLYVAATRAKRRLHLFASLSPKANGDLVAPSGSLLAPLWDSVTGLNAVHTVDIVEPDDEPEMKPPALSRLPTAVQMPAPPAAVTWAALDEANASESEPQETLEFDWASPSAALVGTLLHGLLENVAEQGLEAWDARMAQQKAAIEAAIRGQLAQQGLLGEELQLATAHVLTGLENSLSDEQGRWLLTAHEEAVTEFAFTHVGDNGQVRRSIVDRSFIADGVRWVVDYKTGGHEGGGVEQFVALQVQRHQQQLARYGALYSQLDSRPVKLALYFPMLKTLKSWDYQML